MNPVSPVRAALFTAFLYLSILICGIAFIPTLVGTRRFSLVCVRGWAWIVRWGFTTIMGVEVEVRGLEHRPAGPALVAAKHQSMFDVVAPFTFLDDPCFVMKKELVWAPFFGWYAVKSGMIPVDREGNAKALKKLLADVQDRMSEVRQTLIFPEGTRTEPGAEPQYKPGVAALYRDLGHPCHLIATNSGAAWPAHGTKYRRRKVVFEFLEPIPAGLKRGQFMTEMQDRIETATARLLAEVM